MTLIKRSRWRKTAPPAQEPSLKHCPEPARRSYRMRTGTGGVAANSRQDLRLRDSVKAGADLGVADGCSAFTRFHESTSRACAIQPTSSRRSSAGRRTSARASDMRAAIL